MSAIGDPAFNFYEDLKFRFMPVVTTVVRRTLEQSQIRTNFRGLVVKSRLRGRKFPGLKPDSTEDLPRVWACCMLNHTKGESNVLPLVWCGSMERGVPARVLSSSSDSGSILRVLSQNSNRVASKRDFNVSKLN
ncbi:hypothetical protein AVEN_258424-1 [Araneus ventricosus]|uniref:Uncharacterized protein n=1 Tax=Araneus ventricosus TaxID=182803 RepID=A0A4Y2DIR0_ARAVE|nr:hypothetical protein AVEN_258424-1 [Araneus ventricosus]